MILCSECLERLKPDDPRIPVGRYHQSTCDYYCDKPDYYREIEKVKVPFIPRPIVNVTYKVNARSTPAFKELQEQITLINGRLSKYFESRNKNEPF